MGIIPIINKLEKDKAEDIKISDFIEKDTETLTDNDYLLLLEIPKISLEKGVYPKTSSLNSIDYNVAIMEESTLPNEKNSNLILAAHSGTGEIAYFNDLDKLTKGDLAYIYYKKYKYIYSVDKIYSVAKDGSVEVYRDNEKSTLTLVTCKKNTNYKQLVIILYLEKKEKY